MQRFTISLDDELAQQFDELIAAKGYMNRSEAVRDLIRSRLDSASLHGPTAGDHHVGKRSKWCVANVSYVYDRPEPNIRLHPLPQDKSANRVPNPIGNFHVDKYPPSA